MEGSCRVTSGPGTRSGGYAGFSSPNCCCSEKCAENHKYINFPVGKYLSLSSAAMPGPPSLAHRDGRDKPFFPDSEVRVSSSTLLGPQSEERNSLAGIWGTPGFLLWGGDT